MIEAQSEEQKESLREISAMIGPVSIRTIAAITGSSPSTVMRARKQAPGYAPGTDGTITVIKVEGRDGKVRLSRRVDTTDRDATIRNLRDTGSTIRAIADSVDCSVGTVHRVLKMKQ